MSGPLVVVTREEGPKGVLSERLTALGASVWALPCTATEPVADPGQLDRALAGLAGFDWLVVTSARAVDALCERPAWPSAWTAGPRPKVAAVGRASARRLRDAGLPVDLVGSGGGEALGRALVEAAAPLRRIRILWPRAEGARPELGRTLGSAGVEVSDPVAYRTRAVRPESLRAFAEALVAGRIAAVTFAAPSAAEALAAALPTGDLSSLRDRTLVASIGPTTSEALAACGAPPDVQAAEPAARALAEAVMGRLLAPTPTGATP